MGEQQKPCNHMRLNPQTKKCEDCGQQIYLPAAFAVAPTLAFGPSNAK